MSKIDQSIKAKVLFLKLGKELGNVSKACEITGYSRDSYYRYKKLYEIGGEAALIEHSRSKPNLKNRVSDEVKQQVINIALEHPELGQRKVSKILTEKGFPISTNGVRSIWLRYDLETQEKRIQAVQSKAEQGSLILSDKQLEAVELLSQKMNDSSGQLITKHPGYLLVQDSILFAPFEGMEPLYLHTVIDSYSHFTFAKFSADSGPEASRDFLLSEVKPWFDQYPVSIKRILTDRGKEFFTPGKHNAYQQALQNEAIGHVLIKAYNSCRINGLCRQFYEFMEKEFFLNTSRQALLKTASDIAPYFEKWLHHFNCSRPNPARYCYGKTPESTFNNATHLSIQAIHDG